MTIYISGPMTGQPDNNLDAFKHAQTVLEAAGHTVINPHDISETVNMRCFDRGKVADYEDYLKEDIIQMLTNADTVLVLGGWRQSKGAKLEMANALACGIPVVFDVDNIPKSE